MVGLTKISNYLSSSVMERELKFFLESTKSVQPNVRLITFLCLCRILCGKQEIIVKSVLLQAIMSLRQDENELNKEIGNLMNEQDLKLSANQVLLKFEREISFN